MFETNALLKAKGKMEQTQILPPTQTTKRGERAHVHAFSSLKKKNNNENTTDDNNESQSSFTYVNEKTGKAYAVTFPRTRKKTVEPNTRKSRASARSRLLMVIKSTWQLREHETVQSRSGR